MNEQQDNLPQQDETTLETRLRESLSASPISEQMKQRLFDQTCGQLGKQASHTLRHPSWFYPRWWGVTRIAAAVLIVCAIGWFVHVYTQQTPRSPFTPEARMLSLDELDAALAQLSEILDQSTTDIWVMDGAQVTWAGEASMDVEVEILMDEGGWVFDEMIFTDFGNGAG